MRRFKKSTKGVRPYCELFPLIGHECNNIDHSLGTDLDVGGAGDVGLVAASVHVVLDNGALHRDVLAG